MDTERIRRLRARLLDKGRPTSLPGASVDLDSAGALARTVVARVSPMAELMVLMMMADERLDGHEVEILGAALVTLTDGVLGASEIDALLERLQGNVAEQGVDARLDDVTAALLRDREDAEMALVLAAAVAVADDVVDAAEERLFKQAREWLGISERRAGELVGG